MPTETKDKATSDFAADFLLAVNQGLLMLNPGMATDMDAITRFNGLIVRAYRLRKD